MDRARPVPEHLHLDVPARGDEGLEVDPRVAERRPRLGDRDVERVRQLGFVVDALHAAPAPAGSRLDEHGPAELAGEGERGVVVGDLAPGQDGHPGRDSVRPGLQLVPERVQLYRGRAHEDDPRRVAGERELGVLREEPVARVEGVGADGDGDLDHGVDAEVARAGRRYRRRGRRAAPGRHRGRPRRRRAPSRSRGHGTCG